MTDLLSQRRTETERLQNFIGATAQVPARQTTWRRSNTLMFGRPHSVATPAKVLANIAPVDQPKSRVIAFGDEGVPAGFGKQILWEPADETLALVAFLNSADLHGVMISGVRARDTIEFIHVDGLASFAKGVANEGVGALIGLVAAGATATAAVFGAPYLAPVIQAGARYASTQFKEHEIREKTRDAFGVNPDDGGVARQEGGVLISLPGAGRNFYSGKNDNRWIKPRKPGESDAQARDFRHLPSHVTHAEFLVSGRQHVQADTDGDLTIYPWDFSFADNLGFYRMHFLLRRGAPAAPVE